MQNIAEAKELFAQAEILNRKGLGGEASMLYRRAFELCPTLEEFERKRKDDDVPVPLAMQFQRLPDPTTSGFRTFDFQKFPVREI